MSERVVDRREDDDIGWHLECIGGPFDGETIFVKHGHDAVQVRGNVQEWVIYWRVPYAALPIAGDSPLDEIVLPVMVVEEFDTLMLTGEDAGTLYGHRLVPHGPDGQVRCQRCGSVAAPNPEYWKTPCGPTQPDEEGDRDG